MIPCETVNQVAGHFNEYTHSNNSKMSLKDWKNISWKPKYLSLLSSIITAVQWCIIISCLICLIVQVVNCIEKYLKKDTRVIQTVMPLKNATFLAFTVCPSYDDAYKLETQFWLSTMSTSTRMSLNSQSLPKFTLTFLP